MKKLCIIGDPVAHSKSPLLHNTMLAALDLGDYGYTARQVSAAALPRWLAAAQGEGYVGFNATMPHKQALVPLMDVLDEDALACGAVNTVCIKNGKLYGYNTDGRGFVRALAHEGIAVYDKAFTLLGAGGAAKAVATRLAAEGARRVTVCNRTLGNAEALCAAAPDILRPAGFDGATLTRCASTCDVLVNCTGLGMSGTEGQFDSLAFLDALPQGAAVCDLIYSPAETALLAHARHGGHQTMNGLGMLIHQAIFALEHFTGAHIDPRAMCALLEQALH